MNIVMAMGTFERIFIYTVLMCAFTLSTFNFLASRRQISRERVYLFNVSSSSLSENDTNDVLRRIEQHVSAGNHADGTIWAGGRYYNYKLDANGLKTSIGSTKIAVFSEGSEAAILHINVISMLVQRFT